MSAPVPGSPRRPLTVTADIVASVIRVVAAPGDSVTVGQTLLIMESMKMEIPLQSPADGVVTRIAVSVGDVVQEGDVLAEISR
ncbi:MAG: biotin/lipoyl-binding carrier protein [Euzebya sp.]